MSNPYCLIISGPSGSGKSTTAKEIWNKLDGNPAYLNLDSIKHIVKGAKSNDYFLDLARINSLSLAKNFLLYGHTVLLEKAFGNYKYVRPFIDLSQSIGVRSYYFKLTASLDTIIKRVERRRELSIEEKIKIGEFPLPMGNRETAIKIYDFFEKNKHQEGIEIDTEKNSLEEVIKIIMSHIPN